MLWPCCFVGTLVTGGVEMLEILEFELEAGRDQAMMELCNICKFV